MTETRRVYVPSDTTARSVGADRVAEVLGRLGDVTVRRTGSRGLYWLEPLVELDSANGRVGFGPCSAGDVETLVTASGEINTDHHRYLGLVEELPELVCQDRQTFARAGLIEPLSIDDYREHGGFTGLERACRLTGQAIIDEVKASGLRGRGGAAFPTGIKWQTAYEETADQKYIVANADEGDSGTFADRMIMESDPFCLIEGMAIAGLAVGATHGYVYLRAEYPQAIETMTAAIALATSEGLIGEDVLGSGKRFTLEVFKAAGAYICGEETSLLESLEGKRGMVRYRPPLPAIKGLFGRPTIVNNVITLASVPAILARGGEHYGALGMERSRGTLTIQLAGNVAQGGLFEVPFGMPLDQVLYDLGGGTLSGRPIKAVQAGGPLGAYLTPKHFATPLDYESFAAVGGMLGHGGLVVFDDTADLGAMARFAMEFCAIESCGKCTPCRVGAVRGMETIDKIRAGMDPDENRALLRDLCATMIDGSLCALGGMAPLPVQSILDHFPDEL